MKPTHQHKWEVYSTAVCPPCLMVRCACGAEGTVQQGKYTDGDWRDAFHAPSRPHALRMALAGCVTMDARQECGYE